MDGMDGNGLKLEEIGQFFSSFGVYVLEKSSKKFLMVSPLR